MRSRILKKRVARAVAGAYSLGLTLQHALPSFWDIRDVGQQRRLLRERMTRKLGVHPNVARYVTRQWVPTDWPYRAPVSASRPEGRASSEETT